jgi:hypothetical protein
MYTFSKRYFIKIKCDINVIKILIIVNVILITTYFKVTPFHIAVLTLGGQELNGSHRTLPYRTSSLI